MEVVDLMGGAQGEEAHQAYKEGDASHGRHDFIIILLMVYMTCCFVQLFSGDYSVV